MDTQSNTFDIILNAVLFVVTGLFIFELFINRKINNSIEQESRKLHDRALNAAYFNTLNQ
jgi:uncharacterized membrane protein YqhA